MRSVGTLYPSLQGSKEIGQLMKPEGSVVNYDLLYIHAWQILNLNIEELEILSQYLQTGGVILVEVPTSSAMLAEDTKDLITLEWQIPLQSWQDLSRNHPLRIQPFLFAALTQINQQPLQISSGEGIILVEGDLSAAWGLDDNLTLDRNEIRTAQELGINILHFAMRRRQMTEWLQP